MQTKQIIAILAIAAVAIAAVGGAYAYTAELSNDGNDAPGQYLAITVDGTPVEKDYKETFDAETLKFDTVTTWGHVLPDSANSKTQVITYTPYTTASNIDSDVDKEGRNAGLVAKMYGAIALQLGKTLTMKVDSTNMDKGDFYTFTLKTTDLTGAAVALTGTDTPVFVLYYTVDGVPNVIELDQADGTYELFVTTNVKAGTTVVAELYALQVKSAALLDKTNFRFDGITFTFNAEVDLTSDATHKYANTQVLTVTTKNDAATPAAADVAQVIIKDSNGALVIVPNEDATASDGIYKYSLIAGTYKVSAYDGQKRFSTAEVTVASAAMAAEVNEVAPEGAYLKTNPTVRTMEKSDSNTQPAIDLTGMTVDVVFGSDATAQYSVVDSTGLGAVTCDTDNWWKTAGKYTLHVAITPVDTASTAMHVDIEYTVTES